MGLAWITEPNVEGKALRKAVIDDWCARNRVERVPAIPVELTPNELAEMVLSRCSWLGRRTKTAIRNRRAGAEPPPRMGTPR